MIKKILIVILLLFLNESFSSEREKFVKNNQSKIIDSLKSELLFYRVKEDYYATALSDQSTRFSLIVGAIVGLVALVSFAGFKNEVRKHKKDYERQLKKLKDKVIEYDLKILKHEYSLNIASGNIFTVISQGFEAQNNHFLAFQFYLASARSHSKAGIAAQGNKIKTKEEIEDTLKYAELNMEKAVEILKKIILNDNHKEEFKENSKMLFEDLDIIIGTKNEILIDYCANARVSMKNYIK